MLFQKAQLISLKFCKALQGMFYNITEIHYIWVVYSDFGYIRHYGQNSLLLCCDDIGNRSTKKLHLAGEAKSFLINGCYFSVVLSFLKLINSGHNILIVYFL